MSYTLQCPKCHAMMRTYNRNGIQIEQCDGCRGIFLDYGELEALTRLEAQWSQPAPPPPAPGPYVQPGAYPPGQQGHYPQQGHHPQPAWGHGKNRHGSGGFARMLFSS